MLYFNEFFFFFFLVLQLLGKDCCDIDIALDNMLGSEFVDKVTEYLLFVGEEPQGIAVIPRYVLSFLLHSFSYLFIFKFEFHQIIIRF